MDLDKDNKYGDYQTDYYEEKLEQPPTPPQINTKFEPLSFLKKISHTERLSDDHKTIRMKLTANEVYSVCDAVIKEFKKEENLLKLPLPITVVGDVHGNYHDLYRSLLAKTAHEIVDESTIKLGRFVRNRYLFLGDYIERGNRSIECMCFLFALKIVYPRNYFLLRGSQETLSMNSHQFKNALEKFSPVNGNKLYEKFNEAFSWMPLAAIVGEKIFCVHGGISPKLASWNDISNIPRPLLEVTDNELATDLLFSDPLDYDIVHIPKNKPNFETNYLRQKSVLFNEPSVDEFCKEFNIKLIIRSHTYVPFGYRFFADRKLITIFSSSGYRDQRNPGTLLKINREGKITIITLLPPPPKSKKSRSTQKKNFQKNNSTDTGVSTDCTSNLSISSRGPMGSEAGLSSQILKY